MVTEFSGKSPLSSLTEGEWTGICVGQTGRCPLPRRLLDRVSGRMGMSDCRQAVIRVVPQKFWLLSLKEAKAFLFFRILSVDGVISAGFVSSWQSDIPQQNVRYLIPAGFAECLFAAMFGSWIRRYIYYA